MNLSKEELELVNETQDILAAVKPRLMRGQRNMREMGNINLKAGRTKEANACFRMQAGFLRSLAEVIDAHADAADALVDGFDDGGDIVVFGGGGR